jgi:branched-chain amino acid transport system substrate-binding protein
MRRKGLFLFIVVATVILTISITFAGRASAAEKAPIKIGLPYSLTGVMASLGNSQRNAARQLFEEKGMEVAGRKIQLISEDDEAKPDVALTKTKKLVQSDKVNLIVGYIHTAVGYAIRDFVNENQVPTIATFAGARHTRDLFTPFIFRVTPSTFQYSYETSKWWAQTGYKGKTFKRIAFVGSNFDGPREILEAHKKGLKEVGGQIVQELWPNINTADYGPYLTAIKTDQADAIIAAMWGADPVRFVNQWAEYGLNKRIPIIGIMSFLDEGGSLVGMHGNAEGVLNSCISCPQTDIPENKKFVEEYKRRYKTLPGHYAYLAYTAAQAAYEAMDKVKGNVEDKEKLQDALRKVRFTTPMGGRAFFDEKQGMVFDFIFTEARKTNGESHLFEIGRAKDVKDPYKLFP